MAQSLNEVGFRSAVALFATYAGRGADLQPWYKNGAINLDRNLRLQYLAGFGLNLYQNPDIYEEMLCFRKFPQALFQVSEERREVFLKTMGSRR